MTGSHFTHSAASELPDWFVRRVLPRIEVVNQGCWRWTGATNHGYGCSGPAQRATGSVYIHRALWISLHGPIADGFEVDHLCHFRSCVNPAHLRLLTVAENRRTGRRNWLRYTTHCPYGHERVFRKTRRICPTCLGLAEDRSQ